MGDGICPMGEEGLTGTVVGVADPPATPARSAGHVARALGSLHLTWQDHAAAAR